VCIAAQEAVNAHVVKGKKSASTTLLLSRHQDKQDTGIRTKMPRRLIRRLLAVVSELTGSALSAAMSGKVKLHDVCRMTADVLFVATKLLEGKLSNPHLKQHVISCCVNGTMSAMLQLAFIPTTPPLAATSLCIGIVRSVQRDSCTGIKCVHMIVLATTPKGVLTALVIKCANATLWKSLPHGFIRVGLCQK